MAKLEFRSVMTAIASRFNKASGLPEKYSHPATTNRFAEYHSATTQERFDFHESLDALAKLVRGLKPIYKRKGFDENRVLERINVNDCAAYLAHFQIQPESEIVATAISQVKELEPMMPEWLKIDAINLYEKWSEGKPYKHIGTNDWSKAVDAARFIIWNTRRDQRQETDLRTASVVALGNSKRLEKLLGVIARFYDACPDLDCTDLDSEQVLAYYGVSKFPSELTVRGGIIFRTPSGTIDAGAVWPYLALSPEGIEESTVATQPKYILFIENKTTFRRYCREINDGSIVIYTNGFPSRSWLPIFRRIVKQTNCPIYHWGDIDVGGYRILAFISAQLPRPVIPYNMIPESSSGDGGLSPSKLLRAIDTSTSPNLLFIRETLVSISESNSMVQSIEQELLEVRAPQ